MSKVKWIEIGKVALGDTVQLRGIWVRVTSVSKVSGGNIAVQGESEEGELLTYIDEPSSMVRKG
jgi:hypothetical protein